MDVASGSQSKRLVFTAALQPLSKPTGKWNITSGRAPRPLRFQTVWKDSPFGLLTFLPSIFKSPVATSIVKRCTPESGFSE